MSAWKHFFAAIDSSAYRVLETRRLERLTRERKQFGWDWHAWNLLLVTTPGFLLWVWLDRVEKRMLRDQGLRQEIEDATGVSSRGYLVPTKELRDEARGMLRSKNPSALRAQENGRAATTPGKGLQTQVRSQGAEPEEGAKYGTSGIEAHQSQYKALELRLQAIEEKLGLHQVSGSSADVLRASETEPRGVQDTKVPGAREAGTGENQRHSSASLRALETAQGAINLASETATWVTEVGFPGAAKWVTKVCAPAGQRLYRTVRDWVEDGRHALMSLPVLRDAEGADGKPARQAPGAGESGHRAEGFTQGGAGSDAEDAAGRDGREAGGAR